LNLSVKVLYIVLWIIGTILNVVVSSFVFEFLDRHTQFQLVFFQIETPWWLPVLYTGFLFVIDDFARFFLHFLMHKIPALWAFHKVHHSAEHLTPFTVLRTHPIEGILFSVRGALVQGFCIALFTYLFGNQFSLVTVFSANIIVFAFNVLGSNLRHSHVYIPYFRWLEKWIISPAQHQIHHSVLPKHFDKNMGVVLSTWDRIFGTLYLSDRTAPKQYGINEKQNGKYHSVFETIILPFVESWKSIQFFKKK